MKKKVKCSNCKVRKKSGTSGWCGECSNARNRLRRKAVRFMCKECGSGNVDRYFDPKIMGGK
jgi:hypothetical protein